MSDSFGFQMSAVLSTAAFLSLSVSVKKPLKEGGDACAWLSFNGGNSEASLSEVLFRSGTGTGLPE